MINGGLVTYLCCCHEDGMLARHSSLLFTLLRLMQQKLTIQLRLALIDGHEKALLIWLYMRKSVRFHFHIGVVLDLIEKEILFWQQILFLYNFKRISRSFLNENKIFHNFNKKFSLKPDILFRVNPIFSKTKSWKCFSQL